MSKRNDPWSTTDAPAQERNRARSSTPDDKPQRRLKRDQQDQLNLLVTRGLRDEFKQQAMKDRHTMSELVECWIREYLAGNR